MFKKIMCAALMAATAFASQNALAMEESANSKVNRIIAYTLSGNGDVFVSLENNGTKCSYGYYINRTQINFDLIMSLLTAAYHSKNKVVITADDTLLWPLGSSGNPVCQMFMVEYRN